MTIDRTFEVFFSSVCLCSEAGHLSGEAVPDGVSAFCLWSMQRLVRGEDV